MVNLILIRLLIATAVYWALPSEGLRRECSTLLYSSENNLMGARIATDGQWRFPASDSIPQKFESSILTYEDHNFYYHPGIDPIAVGRAAWLNITQKRIVSGGSTLTMQLARILRGNRDRNFREKTLECLLATALEMSYSKKEILRLYAANAPFGGNVVGMETAAWRYFGRSAADLSWAESATLAVLPNSPALIHPGRNRDKLRNKRNRLLEKLRDREIINQTTYELSCSEPLPGAPLALPNEAPHLLERLAIRHPGTAIRCSVKESLQKQTQNIVDRYVEEYSSNHIYNAAALIADVETGEVFAYAGNTTQTYGDTRGNKVDIITSARSTGSVIKPFLYAAMLSEGMLLPDMLLSDTPLNINGFMPQNYNKNFSGVVPAHKALEQSLNVPLVRMLSAYNTGRFMNLLKKMGMTTLRFSEEHYGASLILGGAEGTLWDFCGMYASMARILNHYTLYNSRYNKTDIHPLTPVKAKEKAPISGPIDSRLSNQSLLCASSIWFTFEAMSALNRPEEEADWQQFNSMKRVAWKTGTSYGGRDAWAIGVTPRYVVGVWCGNASGEGRAGLTGVGNAAPIMFDLFSLLPDGEWFDMPYDDMEKMVVCHESGHKASSICNQTDTVFVPANADKTEMCPYHHLVHLSKDERFRVHTGCESMENIITKSWFVLRPSQEYYYRNVNIDYRPLPPFKPGCEGGQNKEIEFIYPEHNAVLFLPKGLSGKQEKFVFRAAHSRQDATLYWYIDNDYLGQTNENHQMACRAEAGKHLLTLTDDEGNQRKIFFEVKK